MLIAAASKGSSGGSAVFLIIIVVFVLLYLVVVRPRQRKQNQLRQQASDLQIGDDVLTAGGVYGRVTGLGEDEVRVEIAPGVDVRLARRAIAAVLTEHPEQTDPPAADEPEGEGKEHWQSAFDEDSAGDKPG